MTRARWAQVTALFQEALERDGAARAAYLDAACAGDGALRAEVESLLAAHQAAGRFAEGSPFEALTPSAVETLGVNTRLAPGSRLGLIRDHGAARRRRDGRGVSRTRLKAQSGRRP